jgi:hypothetical protein
VQVGHAVRAIREAVFIDRRDVADAVHVRLQVFVQRFEEAALEDLDVGIEEQHAADRSRF